MVAQFIDERRDGLAAVAYLVDGGEEREPGSEIRVKISDIYERERRWQVLAGLPRFHVLGLQEDVDLFGRLWALQLLTVEHLLLELIDRLASAREGLGHLAVAATVARGHQISNAAALKERAVLVGRIEDLAELDHLHETETNDGGLGVVAHLETVAEAGADSDNVLKEAEDKSLWLSKLFDSSRIQSSMGLL